jgi:hypothetical protein
LPSGRILLLEQTAHEYNEGVTIEAGKIQLVHTTIPAGAKRRLPLCALHPLPQTDMNELLAGLIKPAVEFGNLADPFQSLPMLHV